MKFNNYLILACLVMGSWAMSVRAYAQCAGCTNFSNDLTDAQKNSLAVQFAPELRFDDGADTFPADAQAVFNNSSNNTTCDASAKLNQTVADNYSATTWDAAKGNIPTYWAISGTGGTYYIDYWWSYFRQPNCIGATGGHDYDWEHTVIKVTSSNGTYKGVSITFFQHAGWYTKRFATTDATFVGDHVAIWVGKKAHGSYHKGASCGVLECCYCGDCRKTSSTRYLDVWSSGRLYEITCGLVWAAWPGQWGDTGSGPLYKVSSKFPSGYGEATACSGDGTTCISSDTQQGCEYSNFAKTVKLKDVGVAALRIATNEDSFEESESDAPTCDCYTIYPNPVKGNLNLEKVMDETPGKVKITDVSGNVLTQGQGKQIDVSGLSAGTYFIIIDAHKPVRFIKE